MPPVDIASSTPPLALTQLVPMRSVATSSWRLAVTVAVTTAVAAVITAIVTWARFIRIPCASSLGLWRLFLRQPSFARRIILREGIAALASVVGGVVGIIRIFEFLLVRRWTVISAGLLVALFQESPVLRIFGIDIIVAPFA